MIGHEKEKIKNNNAIKNCINAINIKFSQYLKI